MLVSWTVSNVWRAVHKPLMLVNRTQSFQYENYQRPPTWTFMLMSDMLIAYSTDFYSNNRQHQTKEFKNRSLFTGNLRWSCSSVGDSKSNEYYKYWYKTLIHKNMMSFPSHTGPHCWSSLRPNTRLHCQTKDTGPVHCIHVLIYAPAFAAALLHLHTYHQHTAHKH